MGQPVVHFELWSKNPEGIGAFYSKIFDWTVNPMPGGDYRMVETGAEDGINGGIMTPQEGLWPGNMAFYIHVDDIDAYLKAIEEAGGKAVVPKTEIPGMGHYALFSDPDDRVIGLWE